MARNSVFDADGAAFSEFSCDVAAEWRRNMEKHELETAKGKRQQGRAGGKMAVFGSHATPSLSKVPHPNSKAPRVQSHDVQLHMNFAGYACSPGEYTAQRQEDLQVHTL